MPCHICRWCFYCGDPLSVRHEHDHFPVPKRAGGTTVVPACINCHDLKDRTPLLHSDPTFVLGGLIELIGDQVGPADFTRQDLPMVVEQMGDVIGRWADLSVEARLVYAKLRAAVEDMALESTSERDERGTGDEEWHGLAQESVPKD